MKTLFILPRKNSAKAEQAIHLANTLKALDPLTELHTLCLSSRSFLKRLLKQDARFITDYAMKHGISLIWFSEGFISYRLIKTMRRFNQSLRIVVEGTHLSSRKQLEQLSFSRLKKSPSNMIRQVIKKEQKEKSLIKLCDILTAPSEGEAIYYRHLSGEKDKIATFTQGVLPDAKHAQTSHKPILMLMGRYHPTSLSMSWATKWFLEKVLPLLQKQYPELSCVMACADNKLLGESTPFSFIDEKSSSTYLSQSAVALRIVPEDNLTRFLEVFAYKIPVVATNFGLGPLPLEHGEHIMIADTPEKFAENIIKLIEDKPFAAYIAEKCYQKAHEYYGIERLKKEAEQIFARIG